MRVEIQGTKGHTARELSSVPCVGDVIIDSMIGQARVEEVVRMTNVDLVRIYVREF